MRKVVFIASLALIFLSSCATIFSGTKAKITVSSPDTNRANLTVDGTVYEDMTLPAEILVKRGKEPSVINAETKEMVGSVTVEKKFNPVSIANLIIWPAWIVDWADGAIRKPRQDYYSIEMNPKRGAGPIIADNSQSKPKPTEQQPIQASKQPSKPQSEKGSGSSNKVEPKCVDVDINIPQAKTVAENTYVLIIANEDYQFIDKVNYASRDGEIFKEYCIKTLGVPEKQVRYCSNASYGVISRGVDWLRYALETFNGGKGIVYYCGHGIPDEKTNAAYIVPVDGVGTNTATCVSLNDMYKTLAATKASSVTYFMDACFTGANKEGSMLVAARGVAIKPKSGKLDGNTIVFSASSGDETAMTYEEKQHGLFTYYLLKKLQETSGDVSYEELANYISKKVKKDAFLLNEKPQTPVVATSPAVSSSWKNMKLK